MNRRGLRSREIYGYALIAGITPADAARMAPGYILDMYMIRARYDARMAAGRRII